MLQLKDFMPVNFLKKEKYTGSCKGMRFRMEKFEKEDEEKKEEEEAKTAFAFYHKLKGGNKYCSQKQMKESE